MNRRSTNADLWADGIWLIALTAGWHRDHLLNLHSAVGAASPALTTTLDRCIPVCFRGPCARSTARSGSSWRGQRPLAGRIKSGIAVVQLLAARPSTSSIYRRLNERAEDAQLRSNLGYQALLTPSHWRESTRSVLPLNPGARWELGT